MEKRGRERAKAPDARDFRAKSSPRGYRRCSGREVGNAAVLLPVICVSFQPQWPQAKSSWGLGFVANSPQRGHFIVHMIDLPVTVHAPLRNREASRIPAPRGVRRKVSH